jgi:hypothetical protein
MRRHRLAGKCTIATPSMRCFDAARLAAMAFLLTEETRWGILANRLPDPFDQRFRSIVEDLHVAIFLPKGFAFGC